MEESRIEKYLKKQVEKIGGKAYKWNPTENRRTRQNGTLTRWKSSICRT